MVLSIALPQPEALRFGTPKGSEAAAMPAKRFRVRAS